MNKHPNGPTRELINSLLTEHATRFEFCGPDPEGGVLVLVDRGQSSPQAMQGGGWGVFVQINDTHPELLYALCERDTDGTLCWAKLKNESPHTDRSPIDTMDMLEAVLYGRRVSDGVIPLPVIE